MKHSVQYLTQLLSFSDAYAADGYFTTFSVGKTALVQQFVHNAYSGQYRTTINLDVLTKRVYVDDRPFSLEVR